MNEVVLSELPENWEWTKLGDVVTKIIGGGTPSKNKPQYWDGDIPWLTVKDMRSRRPADAIDHISAKAVEESATNIIPEDTVIIATRIGLGKVIRVPYKAAINQDLKALVVPPEIAKGYLEYWFVSKTQYLESIGSGTTVKGIRLEQVRDLDFPLAPPEQQKCIVAKIEELFSHIDAGIEALKKAKQLLKQYRQSVLKAAVTGELTKEWREVNKDKLEPASKLLDRILKERRRKWEDQQLEQFKAKGKIPKDDKWKEKYKEPLTQEFEHVNNIPEIPDTWEWVTVSQLTTLVKDGPHYSPKYAEKGIPFITGGNVRPNGIDFENCKFITEELHEKLSKRCKPELNDILYTKGGTTGIARVNTYDFEFNVWVHVAVLRLVSTNSIDPFYMQHALNSQLCYAQSQKYTHGVGNQDLGLTRMIKICLAIPPLEEQREVIGIIDRKMESITRTEEQIEHMLIMGEKNKQSILSTAFDGKLK